MFNIFGDLKQEITEIPEVTLVKRRTFSVENFHSFVSWTWRTLKIFFSEKKLVLFAFLQVVSIALGYYLWVQMLGWIPGSVWESDDKLTNAGLNVALLAWSFLCVGLVSCPIAIFTGCMGASHFLKKQGYASTIGNCFRMVLPRAWSLWMFYWIDCWFTVNQILERLPKKGDLARGDIKALKELLYYAWKLGTVGILPSVLNGKNLGIAAAESIALIRNNPKEVMLLRGGYSLFCWIIGILTYAAGILFVFSLPDLFKTDNVVFAVYSWLGIPLMVSVTVIQFFLRPIFVLGSCELYSEHAVTKEIDPVFKNPAPITYSALVGFFILGLVAATVFVYREPLGLMRILEVQESVETPTVKVREEKLKVMSPAKKVAVPAKAAALKAQCDHPIIRVVGDEIQEFCA